MKQAVFTHLFVGLVEIFGRDDLQFGNLAVQFSPSVYLPFVFGIADNAAAVSYTHLDVYKRQRRIFSALSP